MKTLRLSASLLLFAAAVTAGHSSAPTADDKPIPPMPGIPPPMLAKPAAPAPEAKKIDYKPYPFAASLVSGAPLSDHPVVWVQDGYEMKVSSADEAASVKQAPAQYLAKIKQAYADAKPYPSDKCLVCTMKLDDDDLVFVYEGRQFKVCGEEDCYDLFQKDPAKYVKKWDELAAAAKVTAK